MSRFTTDVNSTTDIIQPDAIKNEYDKTGFSWFDTKTYQSGFVESDLPYLDRYDLNKEYKYRWDYTSGYITYGPCVRATGTT